MSSWHQSKICQRHQHWLIRHAPPSQTLLRHMELHDLPDRDNAQGNYMQYSLYFALPPELPQSHQTSLLQELCALALSHIQLFVTGHVWQKDPFNLQVTVAENSGWYLAIISVLCYLFPSDGFNNLFGPRLFVSMVDPSYPFLHGRTRFGDCIDDEWFIVFLLREISTKFKDVVIRSEIELCVLLQYFA